jgi:hypothetical protein
MIGAVGSSAARQLYSAMQTSPAAKNSGQTKPAASEEMTESSGEKAAELGKGEIIDTYA